MTSERSITKQAMHYLERLPHSWWLKVHGGPYQKTGVPDIIGCYRGRFFAFEIKVPGGRTTPKQDHEVERIQEAGGAVSVVESLREIQKLIGAKP